MSKRVFYFVSPSYVMTKEIFSRVRYKKHQIPGTDRVRRKGSREERTLDFYDILPQWIRESTITQPFHSPTPGFDIMRGTMMENGVLCEILTSDFHDPDATVKSPSMGPRKEAYRRVIRIRQTPDESDVVPSLLSFLEHADYETITEKTNKFVDLFLIRISA